MVRQLRKRLDEAGGTDMAMPIRRHCHILTLTVNYSMSVRRKRGREKESAGIRKGERHGREEEYPYL